MGLVGIRDFETDPEKLLISLNFNEILRRSYHNFPHNPSLM